MQPPGTPFRERTAASAFWTTETRAMWRARQLGAYVLGGRQGGGGAGGRGRAPDRAQSGYGAGSPSPLVRLVRRVGQDSRPNIMAIISRTDHALFMLVEPAHETDDQQVR